MDESNLVFGESFFFFNIFFLIVPLWQNDTASTKDVAFNVCLPMVTGIYTLIELTHHIDLMFLHFLDQT